MSGPEDLLRALTRHVLLHDQPGWLVQAWWRLLDVFVERAPRSAAMAGSRPGKAST